VKVLGVNFFETQCID